MSLKPGTRLFAQNSSCQVVVVRSAAVVDALFFAAFASASASERVVAATRGL